MLFLFLDILACMGISHRFEGFYLIFSGQTTHGMVQRKPSAAQMGHVEVHLPKESWMQVQVKSRGARPCDHWNSGFHVNFPGFLWDNLL